MLVLDTSALIGAWHAHYHPDAFPGFWTFLDDQWSAGQVVVPEMVLIELQDQKDALTDWIVHRRGRIIAPTPEVQVLAGRVEATYFHNRGQDRADPFVIAEASIGKHAVVTYEGTSPTGSRLQGRKDKMRIPDVCDAEGVMCLQPGRAWASAGLKL